MATTHYSTLEVDNKCSDTEIKQAYRALSFKYHPDRNKDADASEKMQKINEAYEILSDKQKRQQYDMELSGGGINPLDHILNDLFRGGGLHNIFNNGMQHAVNMNGLNMNGGLNVNGLNVNGTNIHRASTFHNGEAAFEVVFTNEIPHMFREQHNMFRERRMAPPILEKKIEISFEDSFKGNNIPVIIEREIKMGQLSYLEEEKLYIQLQPGIDNGEIIELKEKGHIVNDIKGDIKFHITILSNPAYERNGLNILQTQTITFKESICGFERIIQHIDGSNMKLVSSRGNVIQNGDVHCIKQKGFIRDGQVGNLIINFKVTHPKMLTEEQLNTLDNILV
jgi:DnaJ-class molecular chaperone